MHSRTKITVRYAETDKMGIAHHSVYPVWYEVGRTDYIKMFGMTNDIPLAQQFAGYALVVTFLLHIVTGLLPDFSIIGWLLQFYIVFVVWEGARVVMLVEEKNRLRYTIFSSILLILCPAVIQVVFNKLTAILN